MQGTQAGYATAAQAKNTPRTPNLNERLNRVSEYIQANCDRIEAVLSRVNGTPQAEGRAPRDKLAQISPTIALATVVEHLESAQARLSDLASGLERIA